MLEDALFRLLALVEQVGVWLSILAWISVAAAAVVMAYVLRNEKRGAVWAAAAIVGAVALGANLADYFVTLYLTPDLSLEANPLWRNMVKDFGLHVAKWYGLTGKILVSILAGQMFAFYLSNRERLFPDRATSLVEFLRGMGNRSKTLRERLVALITVFAFFFAGVQPLFLYIAYLNWTEAPARLPSVPVAIMLYTVTLAIVFVATTYQDWVRHPSKA